MKRLIATHLVGDAAILWLGYYWLGVGETRAATLAWSAAVAILGAAAFCWLHGAGFAWREESSVREAFHTSLRNLAAIGTVAVVIVLIYSALSEWADYSGTPAFRLASFLTLHLRKPVKPRTVLAVFNVVLWLVRWVVIPVRLAPAVATIAARGWVGFGAVRPLRRAWLDWLRTPVLLLAALWLPLQVMAWHPLMSGFWVETASVTVRGLAAYLLFVGGLLAIELWRPGLRRPEVSAVAEDGAGDRAH